MQRAGPQGVAWLGFREEVEMSIGSSWGSIFGATQDSEFLSRMFLLALHAKTGRVWLIAE
jgi:hypothetical protein